MSHRRSSTATWDGYQLKDVDEVPEAYKLYKNRILRPLPQDPDPNRFADGDWQNLLRDPEEKFLWIRGKDKADMRDGGELTYVTFQPFMLFLDGAGSTSSGFGTMHNS